MFVKLYGGTVDCCSPACPIIQPCEPGGWHWFSCHCLSLREREKREKTSPLVIRWLLSNTIQYYAIGCHFINAVKYLI